MQNMDWLEEELGGYENEYLIFDCPGKYFEAFVVYYGLNFIRSNRTLHASSFPTDTCGEPPTDEHSYLRNILDRITVYGGSVQVFQVK